ncbi:BspA family leucine-rich repeat surface protein [Collinsella sp. AF38-3AC]|nr:BspA family leucine-rich repeat surface protein [Collinsella sp. AF38-3AC]
MDISSATDTGHLFYNCTKITDVDISNWNLSNVTSLTSMFACCRSLKSVHFGNTNFANLKGCGWMFDGCYSLILDCSNWIIPSSASHDHFNSDAPGVVAPKIWAAK